MGARAAAERGIVTVLVAATACTGGGGGADITLEPSPGASTTTSTPPPPTDPTLQIDPIDVRNMLLPAAACPGTGETEPVPIQLSNGSGQLGAGIGDGYSVNVEPVGVMDVDGDHVAEHIILSQCSFGGNAMFTFVAAVRLDETGAVVMIGDLLSLPDPATYEWGVDAADVGDEVLTTHQTFCLAPGQTQCFADRMTWRLQAGVWTLLETAPPQPGYDTVIHDFDFDNAEYRLSDFGDIPVKAANGEFTFIDDFGTWVGHVGDVAFGDLTGDGVEEAAVALFWVSTEATSCRCETVAVFQLDGTLLRQMGIAGTGDRNEGGLYRHYIRDQAVTVLRYGGDAALADSPVQIDTQRLSLDDGALVDHGTVDTSRFIDLTAVPNDPATPGPTPYGPISFLPGTSSAVIEINSATWLIDATIQASAGQTLTIDFTQTGVPHDFVGGSVSASFGGSAVIDAVPGESASAQLPSDGVYTISVGQFTITAGACNENPACDSPLFFTVRVD